MSKITASLEVSVAAVVAHRPAEGVRATARQRAVIDHAFVHILKLIAPRIRHFIRQYGLIGHWEDAEQCCAIGVHRAIESYDPSKAQFTTFVNWQIRGELQSLRFRVMTDQRPSAKKVDATTVSLTGLSGGRSDGEELRFESLLVDETALERTETGAADYLARAATRALIDAFISTGRNSAIDQLRRQVPKRVLARAQGTGPRLKSSFTGLDPQAIDRINSKFAADRAILELHVFGESDDLPLAGNLTREQIRQIGKRAAKLMTELTISQPRFRVMAESLVAIHKAGSVTTAPELRASRGALVALGRTPVRLASITRTLAA
jgi:hypothetical protein